MATIIALDISGNFKEGKGTTGIALGDTDKGTIELSEVKATDYESDVEYWDAIIGTIADSMADHVVVEHYVLYNHKALQQSYSELETSQLLGAIKYACSTFLMPVTLQKASEAKGRFPDRVLQAKKYLDDKNRHNGKATNPHKRDALRHLLYFAKYNLPKGD